MSSDVPVEANAYVARQYAWDVIHEAPARDVRHSFDLHACCPQRLDFTQVGPVGRQQDFTHRTAKFGQDRIPADIGEHSPRQ